MENSKTHTHKLYCLTCNGICKFVQVGGPIPYEEIEAEILRRRRLAEAEEQSR